MKLSPFWMRRCESAQQCGAKSMLASTFGNLGWCYLMLGDIDRAQDALPAPNV
jgi:hypothetical protein